MQSLGAYVHSNFLIHHKQKTIKKAFESMEQETQSVITFMSPNIKYIKC